MIDSSRKLIRRALKALLATLDINLFFNDPAQREPSEMPCISAWWDDENLEKNETEDLINKSLFFKIELIFGGDGHDDQANDWLDDVDSLIQNLLYNHPNFGLPEIVKGIKITRIQPFIVDDSKSLRIMGLRMHCEIYYQDSVVIPDNILNEFKKFNVDYLIEKQTATDDVIIR
jgi:hypothetical protein